MSDSGENYGMSWQWDNRVTCLIDMDCYEVQVHDQPWMKGKPRVVVNSSGRILAVSYEAKLLGINRETTPYSNQALAIYGNLIINEVPNRGENPYGPPRPDTSIAREATGRVVTAIKDSIHNTNYQFFGNSVFQYSSGDEFYINFEMLQCMDNTEVFQLLSQLSGQQIWQTIFLYNQTVVGVPDYDYSQKRINRLLSKQRWFEQETQEARLLIGAGFSKMVTNDVWDATGYESSVGVASNKLMAKICSAVHKPGSITVLAPSGFNHFAGYIKIENIPGLGQNIGRAIKNAFDITAMSQLRWVEEWELQDLGIDPDAILEKANGMCSDPVIVRDYEDTSGVSRSLKKRFNWDAITDMTYSLCEEMVEKLEFEKRFNQRTPSAIKLKIKVPGGLTESARITNPKYRVIKNSNAMYRQFEQQLNGFHGQAFVDNISIICNF